MTDKLSPQIILAALLQKKRYLSNNSQGFKPVCFLNAVEK